MANIEKKEKIVTVSAIGLDSPGLVAKITTKIYDLQGNIIDVEENCRRGLFSIFLIIDFTETVISMDEIRTDLKDLEIKTGLKIIIAEYKQEDLRYISQKENHMVTILGVDQPGIIAKVSKLFHDHNINIESCKMIARGTFFSMEMIIDTSEINTAPHQDHESALEKMKLKLKQVCNELNQSVVVQSEDIYRKVKKLVVFDVESTLLQQASMNKFIEMVKGEISPDASQCESLRVAGKDVETIKQNAMLLKGINSCEFENVADILELNPGAVELINILKSMGFKIALLSSGYNIFIKKIFEKAGVDYAFSNTLKTDENGIITGKLEDPIITDVTKNEILEFIMNVEEISRDQVIAVGDGSTQSHFMKDVGLSIAFKQDGSDIMSDGILSSNRIKDILFCLGIPKSELDKVITDKE